MQTASLPAQSGWFLPLGLAGFGLGLAAGALLPRAIRALRKRPVAPEPEPPKQPGDAQTKAFTAATGPMICKAIHDGELALHYQPKLSCRTNQLCGAEALSRWTMSDGQQVTPDQFVKAAERLGGIAELTLWAVRQAQEDLHSLGERQLNGPLFVNLSAQLITDEFVNALIDSLGADTTRFGFEVTETAVIDHPQEALRCLHRMREAGIALAIDDYGAGLSSLNYLKQIPATDLKIDKQFVMGMISSHRDPLIVRSTIDLCHGLGLTVTAEGVENVMTASLLQVMGCDLIQGYYVSRPIGIESFREFIDSHQGTDLSVPQIRKEIREVQAR